ncbi:MAG: hypothetical protein O6703_08250, partial [Gammaproteobacteria bacterium]|nr:hypothetical protein [Gammaproteobacteria bacterium]
QPNGGFVLHNERIKFHTIDSPAPVLTHESTFVRYSTPTRDRLQGWCGRHSAGPASRVVEHQQ